MKLAGILSIITSPFVFFSSIILMESPNLAPEMSIVFSAAFIGAIFLFINGIVMIRTANRIRNLEQKFLYVSGLAGSDYLGDR